MAFNNFPSAATVFNGSNDDLQREKRLNNWIRSYSLPAMIGDAVQGAMLNNPHDRSASLRAELAQQTANSVNLPWRTREALANELFRASPIDATSGDGAAPGQRTIPRNPRTATQSAGPVAARGNINGQDVMVPTAGNYLNGAYQGELNALGLGDTPSVEAYNNAVYNYKTPQQRQADAAEKLRYDRAVDVARIQSQGKVDAAAMKSQGGTGKDKTIDSYRKQLGVDRKQDEAQTKELHGAYERYLRGGGDESVSFDDFALHDPVAMDIRAKYQQLGAVNGKAQRDARVNRDNIARGNMTDGAKAEDLTQKMLGEKSFGGASIQPEVQSKVSSAIQQAKANGATDEQILAAAQQSGLSVAELSAVQAELEGKAIRKAQYGAPAKAKSKKTRSVTPWMNERGVTTGPNLEDSLPDPKIGRDIFTSPSYPAQQPSLLDDLVRRVLLPGYTPTRFSAGSPIA